MKVSLLIVFLCSAWLFAFAPPQELGTIEGSVLDKTEAVVPHASVVLENSQGQVLRSTTSDETGHFRIEHFPTGERVVVSAWHPLFAESKLEVTLAPGEHKQIELILTPKAADVGAGPGSGPKEPPPSRPSARSSRWIITSPRPLRTVATGSSTGSA